MDRLFNIYLLGNANTQVKMLSMEAYVNTAEIMQGKYRAYYAPCVNVTERSREVEMYSNHWALMVSPGAE